MIIYLYCTVRNELLHALDPTKLSLKEKVFENIDLVSELFLIILTVLHMLLYIKLIFI